MQEEELPPWARKEKERELASMEKKDLPFGVYLLGSAVVAIAAVSLSCLCFQTATAVGCLSFLHADHLYPSMHCLQTGSWFELANKNPIFGVLGPDNPLWKIILGFFGVSGYPTAGQA